MLHRLDKPMVFNPAPRIETVTLLNGAACFAVDDALPEPERLVDCAGKRREEFRNAA